MQSRARFLGHPVHQMLVVFPLGLLGGAALFDALALAMDSSQLAVVARYLIVAGVISALVAVPFGTVDWLAIPAGTRAKSVGLMHALGNVVVLVMFAASWWLRRDDAATPGLGAQLLSIGGAGLSLVTAWLGGELVSRLGVGVSDGAHLDASSSLREPDAPGRVPPKR